MVKDFITKENRMKRHRNGNTEVIVIFIIAFILIAAIIASKKGLKPCSRKKTQRTEFCYDEGSIKRVSKPVNSSCLRFGR